MNNKKLFSVNMFLQTFKQLKLIGILGTIVTLLFVVFPQISSALSYLRMLNKIGVDKIDPNSKIVYASSIDELAVTFMLITPILVLNVWNFLNKKNASDFYHSLPYRRECLYLSKLAAVFLWQFIIHVVTYVCLIITFAVFKECFVVEMWMVFRVFLSIFFANLLCGAAITLACSLTGNIFSNICLSGLIIFLPRFICAVLETYVSMQVPVASTYQILPLINNAHNIVTGYVFRMFIDIDYNTLMYSVTSLVYTFILALIYTGLGLLAFKIRKSETAQKSALNSKIQMAISTIIGFVFCFIGVLTVFSDDSSDRYVSLVVLFIIAAGIVIVYELLSGKRTHLLKRAIPPILAGYVLSFIFGTLVNVATDNMLDYAPKAEDISYIRFNGTENRYSYRGDKDYYDSIIEGVEIADKEACEIVARSIADNAAIIKKDSEAYWKILNSDEYSTMDIFVKSGLLGTNRKVFIKNADMQEILTLAAKDKKLQEKCKILPNAEETLILWDSAYMDVENSRRIYNIYKEECNEMDYADILKNVSVTNPIIRMSVTFSLKGQQYVAELPISSYTPKAAQAYLDYTNKMCMEQSVNKINRLNAIFMKIKAGENVNLEEGEHLTISISNVDGDADNFILGNERGTAITLENPQQAVEVVDKFLAAFDEKKTAIHYSKDAIIYQLKYYNYDENGNNELEYYIQ